MVSIPQSAAPTPCTPLPRTLSRRLRRTFPPGVRSRIASAAKSQRLRILCQASLGLALLLSPVLCHAQVSGAATGAPPQVPLPQHPTSLPLSAAATQTLAALAPLDKLPAELWRVHAGDLPHGEAPELDDSSWPEVKGPYLGQTGPMWFRRTIVVPAHLDGYDLTGANIRFAFDVWAEGPVPIIVYFDGRRVAMGEAMEPISLFTNAKPGDKILVAVKALDSADAKHLRAANLKIDFPKDRPDPRVFRLEALSASNLVPALLDGAADKQAQEKQDTAVLEEAVSLVDLKALRDGRQQAFDASLRAAQAKLEPLRPLLSQANFHLTGNAHIDAAWVWPWTETVDSVRRTFGTALQLMREYPAYTYSQSQSAYYEWMAEKYPPVQRDIASRIKEGRWEAVGGMWVEPDLNLLDGESIVRQLLVGTRYLDQQYGATVHVGWNPDTFGYTWQLPQIYKKSGIDYFVTQKMGWNESHLLPLKLFYWQSPDGSRVLSYFPHDYNNPVEPAALAADFNIARRDNPGVPSMMHLYGVGDHGGGPTRAMLDYADSWMDKDKVFPKMTYGTAESYFKGIEGSLETEKAPVWNYATLAAGTAKLGQPAPGKVSVPVWNDELYLEYTRGVYTTEATQKRNMRESEEWMLDAEKWSALASLGGGAPYPGHTLNEAWKKVLFNQFHDIAGGSGVGILYKDAQRDYDDVHLVANAAKGQALGDLASSINTLSAQPNSVPVVVWNSLAWPRTDVVEAQLELPGGEKAIDIVDQSGRAVPSQPAEYQPAGARVKITFLAQDVPALGYRVFYARAAGAPHAPAGVTALVQGSTATLQNDALALTLDMKTGCITSLVDRKTGFDSIAHGGCGNELQTFKDTPSDYDAWNIDPGTLDHPVALDHVESASLITAGPLCAIVRITKSFQRSHIAQDISLCAGLDRVDVSNTVAWHEQHVLLKAAFPLAATAPMATYEIPYGSIERPATRNNSWEAAMFEVPALRWADLGDATHGFSLLNEAKYGYDAQANVLRLTLLRSSTAPDPLADQGEQKFAFSLYPHAGSWKQAQTVHRGYEFNYRLAAEQVAAHPGPLPASYSFISLAPDNLILTAAKKSEDGDGLILRFYESTGDTGTATVRGPGVAAGATQIAGASQIAGATLTNLMEKPEGEPLNIHDGKVAVPFTPYSIVTVRLQFANKEISALPGKPAKN